MNWPNRITLARIVLVPVFMGCFFATFPYSNWLSAAVFALAAFTDGLDGHIARKYNLITNLGKFLDPLADKLLITAALICLVEAGQVSSWAAVIIVSREFAVTGLRIIGASRGIVIAASKLGKYKTVSQIGAVLWIILGLPFSSWFIGAAVILTVVSGVDYFYHGKSLLTEV